ncbi:MAG: hypothetical protein ACKVPX_17540 [Myxococcaceae bacterium]
MVQRILVILVVAVLLRIGDSAAAPPTAACCVNTTSRLDSIVNPIMGGDENIFTRRVGPPAVVFLIGNHQSMQDYVSPIPDGTANSCGAGDPFNSVYNAALGMTAADADADFGANPFFDPASFYVAYGTRLAVKTTATAPNNLLDPDGLWTDFTGVDKFTAANICARLNANYQATRATRPRCTNASCSTNSTAAYTMSAAELATCNTCVTTVGWYRGPHRVRERADIDASDSYQWGFNRPTHLYAIRGNYLNQKAPKFVTARKVVKDTINSLSNVRLGVATFGTARNSYDPANMFAAIPTLADPVYGTAGAPSVGPSCAQSFPMDATALATTKTTLIKQINNVAAFRYPRTLGWEYSPPQYPANSGLYFTNGERSVGEALFSVAGFFSPQRPASTLAAAKAGQWWTWFRRDNTPAGYPAGDSSASSACVRYTTSCVTNGDATTMWVKAGSPFAVNAANDSFCWSCGSAAVIILVDGVPYADNSVPAGRMLQLVSGALPAEGTNTTNGINFCNRYAVCGGTFTSECTLNNAGVATNAGAGVAACTKTMCDAACGIEGPVAGNRNFMDDTSFFMSHFDLRPDISGPQNVSVYTVGFGSNAPMLRSIAEAGQGQFYLANDAAGLQTALTSAVSNVLSSSTGFAAASVPSIQTSNAELTAVLPRMTPRTDANWRGELWRFEQYNEFINDVDKNTDGDKSDIFVVDVDGDIVIENGLGAFLKANALTPANPAWEARRKLVQRNGWSSTAANRRKIWTVLDNAGGDNAFTSADTMVEIIRADTGLTLTASETALANYLGVLGTGFCPTTLAPGILLTKTSRTPAQMAALVGATPWPAIPTQANFDTICIRGLIDFLRGRDLTDEDGDGNRDETAESVLADIFHSSPAIVQPPIDKFLCELSAHNQCVVSLFGKANGTPITPLTPAGSNAPTYDGCTTVPRDAYDTYRFRGGNGTREKVILVGANDGMLHAIRDERFSGAYTGTGCPRTPDYAFHPTTSGEEAWAFIPPSLLPRLHEQLSTHVYLLDGDVMVRDVWADASGAATSPDGVKQWDEFHSLAVVSEGRGGNHYTGLEVAFDASTGLVLDRPNFRWLFPQPCSEEAAEFGKTLVSISPKPPPIGPILLDASTILPTPPGGAVNRMTYRDAAGVSNGVAIPTVEKWILAVSGGWEPSLDKGRGIYVLDAWDSKVNSRNDNLLWKMAYDPAAVSNQNGAKSKMTHSIAAPVALVDYSGNEGELARSDGFFDTAIVGDTHGQLWLARMSRPGRINATSKLIENWAGGRFFEQGGTATNMRLKHPFFYTTTAVISPTNDALRVLVGTGNRYAIQDLDAGACRFDNPQACSRNGCGTVQSNQTLYKNGIVDIAMNQMQWGDRTFVGPTYTKNATPAGNICGVAGGAASAYSNNALETINACPVNFGDVQRLRGDCRQDAAGNFFCERTDVLPANLNDMPMVPAAGVLTSLSKNRFYGVWAYGGKGANLTYTTFNEEWTAAANATQRPALYFDTQRLTDQTGSGTPRRELVNVSTTTCTTTGCTGPLATDDDGSAAQWGWALEYEGLSHRTATSAIVFGGCALWNGSYPDPFPPSICTFAGAGTGRVYQGDFITGAPNCAAGFLSGVNYTRYQQRDLVAPPPEPTSLVQVSSTGQVMLGIMMQEPGASQATVYNQSSQNDVLQTHFELQLNRRLHECRHVDKASCVPSPP